MLEVKGATIAVRNTVLAKGLSFTARDGQLTCITGPEGSGKTVLLRTLMGFLPVREGFVSVDGELLTVRSAHAFRTMMVYLPQQMQSLRHQLQEPEFEASEPEEYAVWNLLQPVVKPQVPARLLTAEEIFSLAEETLRQGEKREIVIADEPAALLPQGLAERMLTLLLRQAEAGKTVLIASRKPLLVAHADQIIDLKT